LNGKKDCSKTRSMQNNLKVLRAIKSYTQQDLADKIQVSRQTINAMEKGKYVPSTVLALRLATIFETSVLEIFSLEESDWD
jgi:putative transcriptional regulator